jgi:predicted DCC family thiol-disulfide oxidoreductase YuxK
MTPPLREACQKAVHLITSDGKILRGGRASLFILERVGWKRSARIMGWIPFVWCVEGGYRLVARNRSFFAKFFFTKPPDNSREF